MMLLLLLFSSDWGGALHFFFLFCPFVCVFAPSLDSSFSVVFFDDSRWRFSFSLSRFASSFTFTSSASSSRSERLSSSSRLVVFADLESSSGLLVLVVVQKVNVVFLRCLLVVRRIKRKRFFYFREEGERRRSMIAKTSTAPLFKSLPIQDDGTMRERARLFVRRCSGRVCLRRNVSRTRDTFYLNEKVRVKS